MHPHPNYDRSHASGYAGQAAPASTPSASALPASTSSTSWSIGHYGSHPAQQQHQQQQQQQTTQYHTYPYPSLDDSRTTGGSRSIRDQPFVDTTFNFTARSTTHEGTIESIAAIPQDQYLHQHHNLRLPHVLSSSSLPMDATRSMPQMRVEFALPHLPGKARKRHKVATSCNRCRQNKRKCDSQVPCSNCKKNNVDCCYTDAQLSRTIWGDSPLSQEKVIGVAANRPKAQGAGVRSGGTGAMVTMPPYTYGPSSVHSLFLPGTVSNDEVPHISRTQQVLGPQSKSVSKALRVAQRGSVQYRTPLFPREPLSSSFSSSFSSSSSSHMSITGQQPETKPGNLATAAALTSIPHMMASASASGQLFTVGDAVIQDIHQQQPNLTDRLFASTLHQQHTSTGSSLHGLQRQHLQQQSQGQYGQHSAGSRGGDLSMQVSHDDRPVQQASSTHSSQHDSFSTSHSAREEPSFPSNHQQHIEPMTYSPPSFISPADGSPTVSSPSHSNPGAPTDLATMGNASQPTHTTAYTSHLPTSSDLFTSATSTPPLVNTKFDSKHLKTQQELLQGHSQHHQRQASGPQQDSNAATQFSTALHQFSSTTGGHPDIFQTEPMSITNPVSGTGAISVNPISPLDEPWSSSTHVDGSNQHAAVHAASPPAQSLNVKTASTGLDGAEANRIRQERESRQLQKIAGDVLAIKKFDLSILMPRHISQEQDEFFITSTLTATSISGIPNHLLLLPRDANYLADVFFDHAYFYYPIINRATVELCLMEPQTPHALFVLNIIFMIACRHLARTSDMKRAIQFRERAREVQLHIDSKLRHTRLQGLLLGYLAVYGPFNPVIGLAQGCGTYNVLATTPSSPVEHPSSPRSPTSCDVFSELQAECRSVHANRGVIHEAAYQARLWTFWGFFIRDSVARLYFGWPHGLDRMFISAELPKIEGFVGVGGKRSPLSVPMGDSMASVTGKRRGSTFKRDDAQSDKRQMTTNAERDGSEDVDRATYRNTIPDNSDDEDEGEGGGEGEASMLNVSGKRDALQLIDEDDDPADQDRDEQGRRRLLFGIDGSRKSAKDDIRSFSVLSPKILSEQSKGHHQLSAQVTDPVEMDLHMERMKLLLDSEEDSTDGGSYCRVLFLEEVRLWILGRRVALYLAGRSSNNATMSASACPTMAKDVGAAAAHERSDATSPLGQQSANNASLGSLANRLSTGPHNGAGVWSEQAWLQDQELQALQADLIAWDKALPEHLKFRPDVDSEDVNHKINGKMGTLTMSYYTITIMLQSSYLPIPQFLSSRRMGSRGTSASSDRNTAEAESDSTPKTTSTPASSARSPSLRSVSTATSTPVVTAAPSPAANPSSETDPSSSGAPKTPHGQALLASSSSSYSPSSFKTHRRAPSSREYFNTPHQICSQLSNVLLHHVELMLDSYPNWCTVAAKVNHAITAALRVSCLNARLSSSSRPEREEARAGFKMGTDLYKRLAHLPGPLTIRDWPVEEDIQLMMDIEEEFREMMMTQEEQDQSLFSSVSGEGEAEEAAAAAATAEAEVKQCANPPPTTSSESVPCEALDARRSPQHLFGLGEEEVYKFEFHQDPLL